MLRAAVFAVAAVSRYVGVAAQQELGTFDSNAAAQNPLKGMLTSPEWSTPPYLDTLPSSLEFYYVGIADVMESMTSFTGMDTFLEPRLAATASRGKHVVLRLILDYPNRPLPNDVPQFLIDGGLTMNAYTDFGGGLSPDYSSPALLAALDAVIAELGSRFDGDQRLGFLQIGLLGFWGEWHTFGLPDSQGIPAATKDRVIAAFSAAFSQTQVQVRVPWGAALTAGGVLGLHDDSFAYSTLDGADNGGVMVPWFFWPDVVAQGGDTVWQRAAMGGELRPELQETIFNDNYPASTEYHQDYTRCVDLTHATYMLNYKGYAQNWGNNNGYTGTTLDTAMAASNRMGYSFFVSSVALVDNNNQNAVHVTVQQKGVAPFYYPLSLTLTCDGFTGSLPGVDDIINEGDTATFTFENVPAATACISQLTLSLDSPMLYPQRPMLFAQNDGTVVVNLSNQPPPPPPMNQPPPVLNAGQDCWSGCSADEQNDFCAFCGSGLCCRQGQWEGQWANPAVPQPAQGDFSGGCDGVIGGPTGHVCVAQPAPPAPPPLPTPPPPPPVHGAFPIGGDAGAGTEVTPVVTEVAGAPAGFTTYRLSVTLGAAAESVYSIHGTPDAFGVAATSLSGTPGPILLPPCFQVATPFGSDVGGVSPTLIAVDPEAEFDSWLTVGLDQGVSNELGTVGMDFAAWDQFNGLTVIDGAVFHMDPAAAAGGGGTVLVAQLTVATGTIATASMGMQGRMVGAGSSDWRVDGVQFQIGDPVAATPPPPAPAPSPTPVAPAAQPAAEPTPAPSPTPVASAAQPAAEPTPAPSPTPVALAAQPAAEPTPAPSPTPVALAAQPAAEPTPAPAGATLAACTTYTCAAGFSARSDASHCAADPCTEADDNDTCCVVMALAACTTWTCAAGTFADTAAADCATWQCNEADDNDTCCNDIITGMCAGNTDSTENFDCPGFHAELVSKAAPETIAGTVETTCCDLVPPPPQAPAAIPQVIIVPTITTYTPTEAAAAGADLAAAIAAAAQPAAAAAAGTPAPPPPPQVTVSSSVEFPARETIPAGFESLVQESLAASIGGGGVFAAEAIRVTLPAAGGRRRRRLQGAMAVAFQVSAPETFADAAASLVVAAAAAPLAVTIGNVTWSGSVSDVAPVVETYSDCLGAFTECMASCERIYSIATVATGIGVACPHAHYTSEPCTGNYCLTPTPAPPTPVAAAAGGGGGGGGPAPAPEASGDDTMMYAGIAGAVVVLLVVAKVAGGGGGDDKKGKGEGKSFANPMAEDQ